MFLKNKVVLLTGASSGIGKAIAIEVAKKDGNLVLVSRREEVLNELADKLKQEYEIDTLVLAKDLSEAKEIEETVEETINAFGHIDYLINSSGMGIFKKAVDFTSKEIDQLFKINTYAMIYLSQLVAREMIIKNTAGHILFISSIAGKIATPSSSVYSASKFAVIGYANSLRLELKRFGIDVTTINPGPVKTDFFNHDSNSKEYYDRIKAFALNPQKLAKDVTKHLKPSRRKRELNRPRYYHFIDILYKVFPSIGDKLAGEMLNFKEDN